jgi:hypothetical protein
MPCDEDERCESQQADTQRHEHQVSQAEQVLWKPFAVCAPPKHGHYAAETRKGGADAGEAEEDVQDMFVHGYLEVASNRFCALSARRGCAIPKNR